MSVQSTISSVITTQGSTVTIKRQTSVKTYGEYTWTTQSTVTTVAVSSRNNLFQRLTLQGGDFNNRNVRIIFKQDEALSPSSNSERYIVTWQSNDYLINDVNKIVLQNDTIAQIADLTVIN